MGSEAQLDKQFCAAMFSVGLSNILKCSIPISRQTQHQESPEFKYLFPNLSYSDSTHASISALFPIQDRTWPILLYKIHDKFNFKFTLVEPTFKSLNSKCVFILDCGLEIYQWNGKDSSLAHRLKSRLFCNRINASERKGKARFSELDQGQEVDDFLEYLNYEKPNSDMIPSHICDLISENDSNLAHSEWISPVLYQCKNNSTDPIECSLDIPGMMKKSLLATSECFIIDLHTQIFLWIGKRSSNETKEAASELLMNIIPLQTRVKWLGLFKCIENHEPEIFKLFFSDWEATSSEFSVIDSSETLSGGIYMDIKSLLSPVTISDPDFEYIDKTMFQINSLLGKYHLLPETEYGIFHTAESYIYLCIYKTQESLGKIQNFDIDNENPIIKADEKFTNPNSMECVIYYWNGRQSTKRAFACFKFNTQQELEELVKVNYGCCTKVTHTQQSKEPLSLLSHLSNTVIYFNGPRVEPLSWKNESLILEIKIDKRYGTTQAFRISQKTLILFSNSCYFVSSANHKKLWIGKDVNELQFQKTKNLLEIISENEYEIVHQEKADSIFWKSSSLEFGPSTCEMPNVRLFRCSCSLGYFDIELVLNFSQDDLREDGCCIIETIPKNKIYIWKGREASEVVMLLTMKSLQSRYCSKDPESNELIKCSSGHFSDTDADVRNAPLKKRKSACRLVTERSKSFSSLSEILFEDQIDGDELRNIKVIEQGSEPLEFTCYFSGWESVVNEEPSNTYLKSQIIVS